MGSRVTVIVNLDRSGQRVVVSKELEVWIVEKTFTPIDRPSADANGSSRMLCSDPMTIAETMKARSEFAKALAGALTEALLDAMGSGDTRMGYPQAPNVAISGPAQK